MQEKMNASPWTCSETRSDPHHPNIHLHALGLWVGGHVDGGIDVLILNLGLLINT